MSSVVKVVVTALVATAMMAAAGPHQSASATADSAHKDSTDAAATVDAFHKALEKGDSTAAITLLASDAVILESGDTETRAEYRSHHLAADIAFTKAIPGARGPLKVFIEGSTAWTVSSTSTQGDYNGRHINSAGVESMVLTKKAGQWHIRSIHWSSRTRRAPAA